MAVSNIAQMFADVKPVDGAKYTGASVALSPELIDREKSCLEDKVLGAAIFRGNLSTAREIMNLVGGAVFIPHSDYTTLELIAEFYGVKAEYVRNLFVRHGIVYQKMPADVVRIPAYEVSAALREFDDVCLRTEGPLTEARRYSVSQRPFCGKVAAFIPRKGTPCFYSARVFLAAASLMFYGSVVPKDSKASEIMSILRRSNYYIQAKGIAEANKLQNTEKRREKETPEKAAENQQGSEGVKITTNGEFVIQPEVFVQVIKVAVKEAVSNAMSDFISEFPSVSPRVSTPRASGSRIGKSPTNKLKKSANWDAVMGDWISGKITMKQAAKDAGPSVPSFRNYIGGKATFD